MPVAAVLVLTWLVVPAPASAAAGVIVVTTTADVVDAGDGVVSLREAVSQATSAGGGKVVLAAGEQYALTRCDGSPADEDANANGDLDGGIVTLGTDGIGADPAVIEQTCTAASGERVLDIDHLTVDDVVVTGGHALGDGGGIRAGFVDLGATASVDENLAAGAGGGVFAQDALVEGSVRRNVSESDGGGVYVSSTVHLQGALLSENSASGDGGGVGAPAGLPTTVVVEDSIIDTNTAGGRGGGVFAPSPVAGANRVVGSDLLGNTANDGGGVWAARALLGDLVIEANLAERNGGGLLVNEIDCCSDTVILAGNEAAGGGGGGAFVGAGRLQGAVFQQNEARVGGGLAVAHSSSLLTVSGVTLFANIASAGALAAGATDLAPAGEGGGVAVRNAQMWAFSTTVHDNAAAVAGGGVSARGGGSVGNELIFSTVTANRAPAGANVNEGGTQPFYSLASVFAEATTPNCATDSPILAATWASYSTDASCNFLGTGLSTTLGADPRLGALLDNGGPVPTRAPDVGSPLRGGGPASLAGTFTDARGVVRPVGVASDIGAVEAGEPLYHRVEPTRVVDTRSGVGAPAAPLGPSGTITVGVGGLAGVPAAGVTAVAVNLTAVAPSADTHLTAWPADQPRPSTSALNTQAGRTLASAVVVPVSPTGTFSIRNNAGEVEVLVDVVGWYDDGTDTSGAAYVAVTPTRVLDTRSDGGSPFGGGDSGVVSVGGTAGVPAGADVAVVNITGIGPSADTHLTVWQDGATRPGVSTLNLTAGDTTANLAFAPLSPEGRFQIRNNSGDVHVAVDVVGYLDVAPPAVAGAGFHARNPVRVMDTRVAGGPLTAHIPRIASVTAPAVGVVPAHASAVVVTLTVVGPTAPVDLRAWAHGAPRPATSNVNTGAGTTRANLAVVPVGADGNIDLEVSAGTAHVLVDVVGYLD